MGKRELIIAAAFVVVAVVAYQLTAPAPKPGERRFSFTELFSGIHRGMKGNAAEASVAKSGTIAVGAAVTELRLDVIRAVPLTIVGEKRTDIGYEASIRSTGPDEATARAYAERSEITSDDLNTVQKIQLKFPEEAQQTGQLTLRVPARLLVRIEGSGRLAVSDVRAVDLRSVTGDVTMTGVQERLTGTHRSGELAVSRGGAIEMTLSASRARLTEIDGPITLTARSGECVIAKSKGSIEATLQGAEFTVTDQAGPMRVTGEQGTLRVVGPGKDLVIDVRRMEVDVTLSTPVPATILTTGETLKLSLVGSPGLALEAVAADRGAIRATDLGTQPTQENGETRLVTTVGGGGPRVILRNTAGDIVIAQRK